MEGLEEYFVDGVENGDPLEFCDEAVSGLAGSLYSELEKVVSAHGQEVVTGILPLLVSVLENLEGACSRVRERGAELELLREDRERLLAQYERERSTRKHVEERCIELEDSLEQERKCFLFKLEISKSETKRMENKARSYADQGKRNKSLRILPREHV
ncbi:C-Jun-amino-terminal kinase-interacting protein 4-like [Latimeria chalumnae]|uniref:C-Jun-amino-terminal kinase-interacting protein 4-like n=1 Tax=Latimeria chalumnae TaxID=7897 RepID=UPI00313BA8FB